MTFNPWNDPDAVARRKADKADRIADEIRAQVQDLLAGAAAEGRDRLTPDESASADYAIKVRRVLREEADYLRRSAESHPTPAAAQLAASRGRTASLSVGRNERTYREDLDPKGRGFMLDVLRAHTLFDPAAISRLSRHSEEEAIERPGPWSERANMSTGNVAGAVVPQYLVDLWAPVARAMRPFANICTHHDLPDQGMTVNIPSLSTGTSAALQSSENSTGSSTAGNDTLVTENVQTSTGNVTISRQAIERGYGVDDFIGQDLMNAVATNLDSTLINQATTGLSALANQTSYTTGSPTQQGLYPVLFQAGSTLEKTYLQIARWSHIVMHPSVWNWFISAIGSTFPFAGTAIQSTDAHQAVVQTTDQYGESIRGRLANGVLICVDGNIPVNLGAGTNQSEVYCVPASELHLFEDPNQPTMLRAEQPAAASLGVLLVAYSYLAYSFRRISGATPQKIGGTGLVIQAGF